MPHQLPCSDWLTICRCNCESAHAWHRIAGHGGVIFGGEKKSRLFRVATPICMLNRCLLVSIALLEVTNAIYKHGEALVCCAPKSFLGSHRVIPSAHSLRYPLSIPFTPRKSFNWTLLTRKARISAYSVLVLDDGPLKPLCPTVFPFLLFRPPQPHGRCQSPLYSAPSGATKAKASSSTSSPTTPSCAAAPRAETMLDTLSSRTASPTTSTSSRPASSTPLA